MGDLPPFAHVESFRPLEHTFPIQHNLETHHIVVYVDDRQGCPIDHTFTFVDENNIIITLHEDDPIDFCIARVDLLEREVLSHG